MADKAAAKAPDLAKLKRWFDEARTGTHDERKSSVKYRDYYDSEQLDAGQRQVLADRRQPANTYNRIAPAINGTLGVVVQGKTDPRAYMRNPPKDQPPPQTPPLQGGLMGGAAPGPMGPAAQQPPLDAGDVASMTLRFIADSNQFGSLKIDVLENMCIEGVGGSVIEWDPNKKDVTVKQVRWEEFFRDAKARRPDFKDARYMGIAKWMYADYLTSSYKDKKKEIEDSFGSDAADDGDSTWEDRPDATGAKPCWFDSKQQRLMVVHMYYREDGDWYDCLFVSGGVLASGPSDYVDEYGDKICPLEMQAAFVDRQNRAYGMVRSMIGPQDDINMRRIKAVHEINTRQVQQVDANTPPIDADTVRAEAARPDGVLPPGWQIVPRSDVVANNIDLLQEAKAEIERMGPVPAILGRQSASASGRADQVKQQAGMTELSRLLGRFNDWEMRVYRQMWARARQFYNDPKWIRVADDDGAPQYVMVNEPGEMDPVTGQPGPPKNHVAQMDVDIVVDAVPDTATLQQEIFNELVQLAQAYGPQAVPFKVLIEMSPLPRKRELVQKLEKAQAEAAQANAAAMQLEMGEKQADIGKTVAETKKIEIESVREAMQGHAEALNPHVMAPPPEPPPGNSGASA